MLDRRKFLGGVACGFGAAALAPYAHTATSNNATVDVLLNEPLGTISPDLYGYLLENLGTVIYDGIWVGERSKIANVGGIRKALIDHLREIKASVIRWPGGNFADYYDWEDGIGPRAKRPRRVNQWTNYMPPEVTGGPQRYDPNQFGTPEFMQLCKLSGGRPFLSANVRSLTAQSFYRWLDYCNSPPGTTTLADARKADGSVYPYGVRFWGIGNEPWIAGGNMSPEEYAAVYRRFTATVPSNGVDLSLIACGGYGVGTDWVRRFLESCKQSLAPVQIGAISLHYYETLFLNDLTPGQTLQKETSETAMVRLIDGTRFGAAEWYRTIESSLRTEEMIDEYWKTMGEFDPDRRIKIAVDEWGAIYRRDPTTNPRNLTGRGVTLRDAVAAAATLNIFNRQCNRLVVANFTGLVNQEGGLFLADGDRFCATPVYHVFKMYAEHQGAQSLRTIVDATPISYEQQGKPATLPALSVSASIRDRELLLTVTNLSVGEPLESSIILRGGRFASGTAVTLTDTDIQAQNTFENPQRLTPVKSDLLSVNESTARYRFPAASVTRLRFSLQG